MRLLVTGGAGYIGSVTAAHLLRDGHAVTVLDNLSAGQSAAVPAEADLVRGDLADGEATARLLRDRQIEAVLHFAGSISVAESMERPGWYFENNVTNGLRLLEAMRAAEVRRIIYSSSAAIFGAPARVPIAEDEPSCPTSPYGESKLAFERMLEWYRRQHGFRSVTLRYFNAAGASGDLGEAHRPESHLIPLLLEAALGRCPVFTIHGDDYPTPDGTCIRDFVHVADLAQAHALALRRLDDAIAPAFNLGSGVGHSVAQVVAAAEQVCGRAIPIAVGPRRPGDPPALVASHARASASLGWRPGRCLSEILGSQWDWMRRRPGPPPGGDRSADAA